MAAYGWRKDRSVIEWLLEEGYRFDFYQAVKLIEMSRPSAVPIAEGPEPDKEAVRFQSRVDSVFPASDVDQVVESEGGQPFMSVNFMGLAGALGPLPMPYTDLILDLDRASRTRNALKDFLDIFNHRLVSIAYRVRKEHRIALEFRAPGQDRFARFLYSLIGLGTRGLQERMDLPDRALLFYTAVLAQQPRSQIGLKTVLADYFQVGVQIEQFCGEWFNLEEDQRTALGLSGRNHRLGADAVVLGRRVWDQHARIEVRLGPLTLDQFIEFLPIGWGFTPLCELARFYLGDECDVDFRLALKASEVPQASLHVERGPRLGWTSWLKAKKWSNDDEQVKISRRSVTANPIRARIPLFADLPLDELENIVRKMQVHRLRRNSVVVKQGNPGESLYVLYKGSVRVIVEAPDGKESVVARLKEGEFFGEMSLLTGKPRTATVLTDEDSVIGELSKQHLEEVIGQHSRVQRVLQSFTAKRARQSEARFKNV